MGHCDWCTSPPHSCPILSQKTRLGHGLAFSSRSCAAKAGRSLVPAVGCQAPVHGNAFPLLNGRKRWCVGNTQCCWSRGLWQRAHPVWCSLAIGRLLSETHSSPRFCWYPSCSNVRAAGWIPGLGLLWRLLWCVPDLSSSGCSPVILQPAFPQAAVQNRSFSPWRLWVCVIQKYTSNHTSLVLLLLLALLGRLCLFSPCFCLIFLARGTCWERTVPWAVSYGSIWMYLCLLSCKFHLKQFFMNRAFRTSHSRVVSRVSSKGWTLTPHLLLRSLIGLSPFLWNVGNYIYVFSSKRSRNKSEAQEQLGKEEKKVMVSTDPGFLRKTAQKQDEGIYRKKLAVLSPLW